MSGEPYSKEKQLGRGPKKESRHRANAKRWEQLRAAKLGPCRVCDGIDLGGNDLHHLVPRSLGGDDQNANLVPLCRRCHERVERRDREACALLRANLIWTDPRRPELEKGDEYAYMVQKMGEAWVEARYPVRYEAA